MSRRAMDRVRRVEQGAAVLIAAKELTAGTSEPEATAEVVGSPETSEAEPQGVWRWWPVEREK